MKKTTILKKLPILLMFAGTLFWAYIFLFDTAINSTEAKIYDWATEDLENGIHLLKDESQLLQIGVKEAVIVRPDDSFFSLAIDSLIEFRDETLKELEDFNDNKEVESIIEKYNYRIATFLRNEQKNIHSRIREEDMKYILEEIEIEPTVLDFNQQQFSEALLNNRIYNSTKIANLFLSRQIGGYCSCCFDAYRPSLKLESSLKLGQTSTGKIYLRHHPCGCSFFYKEPDIIKINGQTYPMNSGNSSLTTTFQDTSPKIFTIEYEKYARRIINYEAVIDTFQMKDTYTIHPMKNDENEE